MKLLLISRDVPDVQVFMHAVNADTRAIVYTPSMSQAELLESISMDSIERLAVVSRKKDLFINHRPIPESAELFQSLIHTLGIKTIDFLACNTLMDPRWTQFYATLGVVVGASNDLTGNLKYGGDWTMESTGEDIEKVYFTQSIQYYQYLLDIVGKNCFFIKPDGLYATGDNTYRQMGVNKTGFITKIIIEENGNPISGIVTNIAYNNNNTVLSLEDGSLWGTGQNNQGMFGLNDMAWRETFTRLEIKKNGLLMNHINNKVSQIHMNYEDRIVLVLLEDGTLWGSGNNFGGQLMYSSIIFHEITSIKILNPHKITHISCGANHTILSLEDGTLWGAGYNGENQLGQSGSVSTYIPIELIKNEVVMNRSNNKVTHISCNFHSTMVVLEDGTLWGSGQNNQGQLGLGNYVKQEYFTEITLNSTQRITHLACGARHTSISLEDGSLWVTGEIYGVKIIFTPLNILMNYVQINHSTNKVKDLLCGEHKIYVLLEDGSLWGMGYNTNGEIHPNTELDFFEFTNIANGVSSLSGDLPYPISNICFPANTPVITDQGIFPIDQLDSEVHTLHEKKIVAITKTVTQEKYLICLEKDALGPNLPSQETILTQNHKLLYHGVMTPAKQLLHLEKVRTVAYRGEVLYNVLMETHDLMSVNHLVCETLDPENGIAKLEKTLKEVTYEEKKLFIQLYNQYVLQHNTFAHDTFTEVC